MYAFCGATIQSLSFLNQFDVVSCLHWQYFNNFKIVILIVHFTIWQLCAIIFSLEYIPVGVRIPDTLWYTPVYLNYPMQTDIQVVFCLLLLINPVSVTRFVPTLFLVVMTVTGERFLCAELQHKGVNAYLILLDFTKLSSLIVVTIFETCFLVWFSMYLKLLV